MATFFFASNGNNSFAAGLGDKRLGLDEDGVEGSSAEPNNPLQGDARYNGFFPNPEDVLAGSLGQDVLGFSLWGEINPVVVAEIDSLNLDVLAETDPRALGVTVAQLVEPEYISTSPNDWQGLITLAKKNALADFKPATIPGGFIPKLKKDKNDQEEPFFSDFIVFGDSYSDTGNLLTLTGGLVPPSPPYFEGRFSNGLITPDYLAQNLELELDAEDNYAVAGAATDQGNVLEDDLGGINLPGLQDQITLFTAQAGIRGADPEALYFLWVNANELYDPFLEASAPTDAAITTAVHNVVSAVKTLIGLGAENLVVPLALDRGITPFADAFAEAATEVTVAYNNRLKASLASLGDSCGDDVNLVVPDFFDLTDAVVSNPAAFGFSNVTDSFLATAAQDPSADVEDYLFFDQNHATTAGHAILADFLEDEIVGTILEPERGDDDENQKVGTVDVDLEGKSLIPPFALANLGTESSEGLTELYSFLSDSTGGLIKDSANQDEAYFLYLGVNPDSCDPSGGLANNTFGLTTQTA